MSDTPLTKYPNTLHGGMSKAADIADLMACSTDDLHRREMQLWVAREIREWRDHFAVTPWWRRAWRYLCNAPGGEGKHEN